MSRKFLPLVLCLFSLAATLTGTFAPTARAQTNIPIIEESDLSGTFSDFKLQQTANGRYKLAGKLTINNLSQYAAKNVRANFYLSTDSEVDPEDLVHSIDLARYNNGKGKLKGNKQVEIPLKQKVVAFVGSMLKGQYLLIELVADNNAASADHHNVVVVGPIQVP